MKRHKSEKYKISLDEISLVKTADENSETITELINQEAFAQISKKFPDLVSYIIGIKLVEKIDDSTVLSSAIVSNGETQLVIPIIYAAGKVDATSYIYNPDTDVMFALTKKVVNFVLNKDKGLGEPVSNTGILLDDGNIRKLFIPPKTWSPKIANSSFLPQLVEAYPEVKIALLEKVSSDKHFAEAFEKAYGDFAKELKKEAQVFQEFVNSRQVVATSKQEVINNSESLLNKEAALQEYIQYGIYIQHGGKIPTKTLVKTASLQSKIYSLFNGEEVEIINKENGCVLGIDSVTYQKMPLLSLPLYGSKYSKNVIVDIVFNDNFDKFEYESFIGIKDSNCVALNKAVEVTPENVIGLLPNVAFILLQDGKPFSFIPATIPFSTVNKIQLINDMDDRYIINIDGYTLQGISKIVILKNSDRKLIQVGNIITIGDKNIKLYPCNVDPRRILTFKEYSIGIRDADNEDNLIKVSYDRGTFYVNNIPTTSKQLAHNLLEQGIDKQSIYSLIKEAEDAGSVEVKAISAKIDMLANMLMNAVGEIKKIEDKVNSFSKQINNSAVLDNVDPNEDLDQDGQPDSQEPHGNLPGPMTHDEAIANSDAQMLDPETQAAIAMQAQQGAQEPPMFSLEDNSYAQDESPDSQQIGISAPISNDNDPTQQQALVDGVNPLANPDVVNMLLQLKDSPVMDTSFLSIILSNKNVSLVIQDQLQNILLGITGLGKIVFNIQLNYNSLSDSMGDSKYKSVLNNMKSLFKKMTDVYVDLVQKSEQYNTSTEES